MLGSPARALRLQRPSALVASIGLVLLAACSAVRVDVQEVVPFDTSTGSTYAWARGVPAPRPEVEAGIQSAIERALAEAGLVRTEDPQPAFRISTIATGHTEYVSTETDDLGTQQRWSKPRGGITVESATEERNLGSLVIELLDGETGGVVWRARADDVVVGSVDDVLDKVDQVVERAFEEFPRSEG